jgi:hypothetical protein
MAAGPGEEPGAAPAFEAPSGQKQLGRGKNECGCRARHVTWRFIQKH